MLPACMREWTISTRVDFNFVAKLLSNSEFSQRTEEIALKNLKHYGFGKSKERMMAILEARR